MSPIGLEPENYRVGVHIRVEKHVVPPGRLIERVGLVQGPNLAKQVIPLSVGLEGKGAGSSRRNGCSVR